jgi:K+-sensing histidine kinase KdpD
MDKPDLRLSDVEITNEQLVDLFKISSSVTDLALHDLAGSIVNMRNITKYLLEKFTLENIESEDTQGIAKNLSRLQEISIEMIKSFKTYFRSYDRLHLDEHFISRPRFIIESIRKQRQHPKISIGNDSPDSLEIVFPGNILFGILSELVENAEGSSKNDVTVLIQWQIKGNNFQCEVHDDGPGIDPAIGDKFVPLDILESQSTVRKGGGLRIINRIVVMAKGFLLFSNSKILGGSLVYFELPILGYSKR